MKQFITDGDVGFRLTELCRTFQWANRVQNSVEYHTATLLGYSARGGEPTEAWRTVQDMLNGDLTPRQAMKKLGVEIRPAIAAPARKPRKRGTA